MQIAFNIYRIFIKKGALIDKKRNKQKCDFEKTYGANNYALTSDLVFPKIRILCNKMNNKAFFFLSLNIVVSLS